MDNASRNCTALCHDILHVQRFSGEGFHQWRHLLVAKNGANHSRIWNSALRSLYFHIAADCTIRTSPDVCSAPVAFRTSLLPDVQAGRAHGTSRSLRRCHEPGFAMHLLAHLPSSQCSRLLVMRGYHSRGTSLANAMHLKT